MSSEGRTPQASKRSPMDPHLPAFTLIELLVVIAIIAVLMAVIMPSLNRAREMGKRAVCMNNTKTLALAWTLYSSENNGIIVRSQCTDQ